MKLGLRNSSHDPLDIFGSSSGNGSHRRVPKACFSSQLHWKVVIFIHVPNLGPISVATFKCIGGLMDVSGAWMMTLGKEFPNIFQCRQAGISGAPSRSLLSLRNFKGAIFAILLLQLHDLSFFVVILFLGIFIYCLFQTLHVWYIYHYLPTYTIRLYAIRFNHRPCIQCLGMYAFFLKWSSWHFRMACRMLVALQSLQMKKLDKRR